MGTPSRHPRHYKFRESEPSSKYWNLANGDELQLGSNRLDTTPVGTTRFHKFRDAEPTSKHWNLATGDELDMSRTKLDTEPLGTNIKNYKFRSSKAARKFAPVAKTQRPLIEYFE